MKFALDERNLAKQFLFWAAIILPILLFLIFGFPLWKNLTFSFSQDAYTLFLEVNKFPLYLFGTCVPLVAIVAYMHRTIQTEKQINYTQAQIKLTEDKNKADSYYSHVKFVIDAINSFPKGAVKHISFEKLEIEETFPFSQPYELYKRIFSLSNLDNGYSKQSNINFIIEVKSYFDNVNSALYKAGRNRFDSDTLALCICDIDNYIVEICDLLLMDYTPRNHMYWIPTDKAHRVVSFKDEEQLKKTLNHIFKTVLRLSDFIGIDDNFLRPHPLVDEEHSLHFYLTTNERLFSSVLPATNSVSNERQLGHYVER